LEFFFRSRVWEIILKFSVICAIEKNQLLQLILNIMQESKSNMGKKIIGTDYGQQNHTPHTHPIAKTHIWLPIWFIGIEKI